jgi:hypothetical protein
MRYMLVALLALACCKPQPPAQRPEQQRLEGAPPLLCTNFSIDAGVPAPCNTFHASDSRPCAICRQEQGCLFARAMVWCVSSCTDPSCSPLPEDKP